MSKGNHARATDETSPDAHPDNPAQPNAANCSHSPLTDSRPARYILEPKDLSQKQRNVALLLLRGVSDREIARTTGVDRMTIARWRKTPSFRRVLEAQRSTVWRNSVARL